MTQADFERWQKALGSRKNVQWKRYASLNHVFMPVEGTSTGAEFSRPGQQIAPEVTRDVAAWVQGH